VLDPWQWALACLGAFLVGVSKTGIAGLGVLTMALFATILPARESVGAVLVILLAGDVVAVTVYRRKASWLHLGRLFPWAALGIVLGAFTLGQLNESVLRVLIGGILVLLVAIHFFRRRKVAAPEPVNLPPLVAALTGLLAGFTTMIANAAGPVMILYLLAMRLPKLQFIGTVAWFFLMVNLFKVPFSYSLGMISVSSLTLSLWLVPVTVAGALSGRWLIARINQQLFETLALLLTLVAALRLMVL
jgi:uncharacterized protein